jgi:hypothetical protein
MVKEEVGRGAIHVAVGGETNDENAETGVLKGRISEGRVRTGLVNLSGLEGGPVALVILLDFGHKVIVSRGWQLSSYLSI